MKTNQKLNRKDLYQILEESLKGKNIRVRKYLDTTGLSFTDYHSFTHDENNNITGWNEEKEYIEWIGVVEYVMGCDNSRIDIVFREDENHIFPKDHTQDVYNIHMFTAIEILD